MPPILLTSGRAVVLTALCLFGAAVVRAGQTPLEPAAWGDPVDGVQLRLGLSKTAPPGLPGDLPPLEVQLRNLGGGPITVEPEAISHSVIEIDGAWYSQVWGSTGSMRPIVIDAAATSLPYSLWMVQASLHEDARPVRRAELRPGRHTVRIRSQSGRFTVRNAEGNPITLVSNSIVIAIPELTSDAERQALVERVAQGGANGLPAARRLIEKYPAAATSVMREAVRVTSDSIQRSQYIDLVATIPGEETTRLLIAWLAAGMGVVSQVRAAEALHARGRSDWVPAVTDAWRRVQFERPQSASEASDVQALIRLLSRSGNDQAIDALVLQPQMPIDMRLAVLEAFLPPPRGGGMSVSAQPGLAIFIAPDMSSLAAGTAGPPVERLLMLALEDYETRSGLRGTYGNVTFGNPRVCDMAALVLTTHWPQRYRFTWPMALSERDAQIAVVREVWNRR